MRADQGKAKTDRDGLPAGCDGHDCCEPASLWVGCWLLQLRTLYHRRAPRYSVLSQWPQESGVPRRLHLGGWESTQSPRLLTRVLWILCLGTSPTPYGALRTPRRRTSLGHLRLPVAGSIAMGWTARWTIRRQRWSCCLLVELVAIWHPASVWVIEKSITAASVLRAGNTIPVRSLACQVLFWWHCVDVRPPARVMSQPGDGGGTGGGVGGARTRTNSRQPLFLEASTRTRQSQGKSNTRCRLLFI